jgi:hypothetical protein
MGSGRLAGLGDPPHPAPLASGDVASVRVVTASTYDEG